METPESFWKQLVRHAETYGLTMIVFTVASSLLIGYISHYIVNLRPEYQRKLLLEKKRKEEEDEEHQDATNARLNSSEQKQVGIVKGMINTDLVASLRKPLCDTVNYKSANSAPEIPRQPVLAKQSSSANASDDDEDLVIAHESGKKRSASLQEGPLPSEKELLNTLGKLHGKLATAQMRARTRKMQADMTANERNDEARAKASQLESIMSLMMQNQEKFGITSEDDIKEQMDMYNF